MATLWNPPSHEAATATATDFGGLAAAWASADPAWRAGLRRAALAAYERAGLPTRRHEDWRYTSLAPLARGAFEASAGPPRDLEPSAVEAACVGGPDTARLVFADGHFVPELSRVADLGAAQLGELGATLGAFAPLRSRLGELARPQDDGLTALATALARDGALLFVPRGARLERPLELVHLVGAAGPRSLSAPRTLIVLEEGAHASVLETHVVLGPGAPLTLPVSELHLGPGSVLEHQRLLKGAEDSLHLATVHARLERGAELRSGFYSFGGALARERVVVTLAGEGAECTLRGLSTARGAGHVDCDLLIDHAAPHGTSRQEYRGLLDGRGRATFHGRVIVRPGAQKAEARQSNRNLLLSSEARADTRPQLEIFTDDVQCSHGATIGQLDPDSLFYLRSRGLDEGFARNLLSHGFANEVVLAVEWPELRARVQRELDGFLSPPSPQPSR